MYRIKLHGKTLYVNVSETCYRFTSQCSEDVPPLHCTHEEADGRLLFHAADAGNEGYTSVLIASEDTDVFIMCLAFQDKIKACLYQKCGTRARNKIVDIKRVVLTVDQDVC